jgi:WD40 repeat protein
MDDVDVAALEEVSDSDDEAEGEGKKRDQEVQKEQLVREEVRREREEPVDEKGKKGNISAEVESEKAQGPDMEEFSLERKIPLSHQIDLRGHSKAVSCISCEPAGNRVVTGSMDYSVKLYDFGGMDMRHRAFKAVEVQDGYPLAALAHTPTGDKFIACTGSCQPKVFTRDGDEVITFVRGDMYLRDLSNTKV